ncbi:MAG: hypothetical protein AAFP18_14200 [Bacteroidota bacterium]
MDFVSFVAHDKVLRVVALLLAASGGLTFGSSVREVQDALFPPEVSTDSSFAAQIGALNEMEANARELIGFTEDQRARLREAEALVAELRREQETLEPVVSANREAVDALFAAQEARAASRVRSERWIGFTLGVLASLVASVIVLAIQYFWRRRKQPPPAQSLAVEPTAAGRPKA